MLSNNFVFVGSLGLCAPLQLQRSARNFLPVTKARLMHVLVDDLSATVKPNIRT